MKSKIYIFNIVLLKRKNISQVGNFWGIQVISMLKVKVILLILGCYTWITWAIYGDIVILISVLDFPFLHNTILPTA